MEDLNRRTAEELISLHNARCAEEDRIEGPWKQSKRDLIDRIRALGTTEEDGPRSGSADDAKTVGALVEALVATELTYDEIVRMVRERFPDARTTARSVASVASVLRMRGVAPEVGSFVRGNHERSLSQIALKLRLLNDACLQHKDFASNSPIVRYTIAETAKFRQERSRPRPLG